MPTKVFVNASSSKLITDPPNLASQAAMYAVLSNESVTNNIVMANLQSIDILTSKYFRYGKNIHDNGLLDVFYKYNYPSIENATAILETKHSPESVIVDKIYVENVRDDYFVFQYLQDNYEWNSVNNLITINNIQYPFHSYELISETDTDGNITGYFYNLFYKDNGSFLVKIPRADYALGIHINYRIDTNYEDDWNVGTVPKLTHPQPNSLVNTDPLDVIIDDGGMSAHQYRVRIGTDIGDYSLYDSDVYDGSLNTHTVVGLTDTIEKRVINFGYQEVSNGAWVYENYVYNDPLPTSKYFVTDNEGIEYPSLGETTVTYPTDEFLPVANLRTDKESLNVDTSTTKYKQNKKLLNKVNLSIDELISGVEENPDIDDIDDAFVFFGVDIYSEDEADIHYLYKFFDLWNTRSTVSKASFDDARNNAITTVPRQSASFIEGQFDIELSYNYISKTTHSGVIGLVNSYHKVIEYNGMTYDNITVDDEESGGTKIIQVPIRESVIKLQYQVNSTNYIEILVHGLQHETAIIGRGTQYVEKILTTDSEDLENLGFLIPIEYNLLKAIPKRKDRNIVLYNALNVTVYTVQVVKLKWYQTGIFKVFITLIALVLTVVTVGQSLKIAYAAGGTAGVTIAALKILVIAIVSNYAVEWLLENVDGILSQIIAVVALIYLSNVTGTNFNNLIFSDKAMKIVNIFTKINSIKNELELENINDELNALKEEFEIRDKDIKAMQDLLEGSSPLNNPLYMLNTLAPLIDSSEEVDQFINRTIHTQNPAVGLLDIPSNYVDFALYLPLKGKIPDLIKEIK